MKDTSNNKHFKKVHSEIEAFLKRNTPISTSSALSISEQRALFNQRQQALNAHLPERPLTIENRRLSLAVGEVAIRHYKPTDAPPSATLLFFHGGGFVYGDLETLEPFLQELASFTKAHIISVDYPLAPEQPFPAAPNALYAATTCLYDQLDSPDRFYIGGSSAGATLAAVIALMCGEKNGPKIAGQVLLCPMTDTKFDTLSYNENATGYNLTREQCRWFLSQYVQDPKELTNPLVAPLRAKDFTKYPPALIVTAQFDPVRDDGSAFAQKLTESGVYCQHHCYEGMIHGFFTLPLPLQEKESVFGSIKAFLAKTTP